MCNCECAVNPQKQGIKPGVMHDEKLYCHECKDVLDFLGDETPKNGAHNKPVIFLHPKDFYGTLIELEQE